MASKSWWVGSAVFGIVGLVAPPLRAEPGVFAAATGNVMFTGDTDAGGHDYFGGGAVFGASYSAAIVIFIFTAEAMISGVGYGGDPGAAGTFALAGGGGFGFEAGDFDISFKGHVGYGLLGVPTDATSSLYFDGMLHASGRLEVDGGTVMLGGIVGGTGYVLGTTEAFGAIFGFRIDYNFGRHEGGWGFMN